MDVSAPCDNLDSPIQEVQHYTSNRGTKNLTFQGMMPALKKKGETDITVSVYLFFT